MCNGQLDFLESLLAEETDTYMGRRDYNRRIAFRFSILASSLSAIATVLIGTSEALGPSWFRVMAMVASAAATVVGAWEAIFGNRKLWQLNNTTIADLYELTTDINFRKADTSRAEISPAEVEEFYARYKKIARSSEEGLKAVRTA